MRPEKNLIAGAIVMAVLATLFYLLPQRENKDRDQIAHIPGQPMVSWQKIKITEEEENVLINITVPRIIIIGSNDNLESEINKTITGQVESLKNEFIYSVTTVAEDNGETNTLYIDIEILLMTPRLISLALTSNHHLAGLKEGNPEQTFLVFDLVNDKLLKESNELFRDNVAWSEAVKIMKTSLLTNYQGNPDCDLLFAPKQNGFAASCIGIDRNRDYEHVSLIGDIPISVIQEFLAPSVLSDVIQ